MIPMQIRNKTIAICLACLMLAAGPHARADSLEGLVDTLLDAMNRADAPTVDGCYFGARTHSWPEFEQLLISVPRYSHAKQAAVASLLAASEYSERAVAAHREDKSLPVRLAVVAAMVERQKAPPDTIALLTPLLESPDVVLRARALLNGLTAFPADSGLLSRLPHVLTDLKALKTHDDLAPDLIARLEQVRSENDSKKS